ncbi:MAG: hypothetical protein Q8R07_00110 [Candidatus Uhrbacteria bacterium]|nr:hypothetical protein [Candidatus Uhrbacteria bacterium]
MKFRLKPKEVEAIEMTAAIEISLGHDAGKACQVGDFLVRKSDGSLRVMDRASFFLAYESCDHPGPILTEEEKPKRRHRRRANGLSPEAKVMLREIVTGDVLSKVNAPSSGQTEASVVEAGLIGPGLLDSIKNAQDQEAKRYRA